MEFRIAKHSNAPTRHDFFACAKQFFTRLARPRALCLFCKAASPIHMIFPRVQSLATAAIFAMTGAVLFADDVRTQAGAPTQQTQSAATQSASTAGGQPGLGLTAPAPSPRLDGVSSGPVFPAENVTGFSVGQPAGDSALPSRTPQNRVVPSSVDNALHSLPGEAAYSTNWLVDGVARLEADEKRQHAGNARDGKTDDETAVDPLTGKPEREERDRDAEINTGGKSGAASNDPLVQYLQKWMETSSGAAAAAVASQPSDSGDRQYQANPSNVAGVDPAISGVAQNAATPRTTDISYIAAQMAQPMLEATGPSIVLPPPPILQINSAQNTMPATDSSAQPVTGVPGNAALKIKPIESNQEPTKPILNDKKYFPQMQRF